MKVTKITYDGTVEELRAAGLLNGEGGTTPTAPAAHAGWPDALEKFIDRKARNDTAASQVREFLATLRREFGAELTIEPPTDPALNYARLYVGPKRDLGAFAYLRPYSGRVQFRLVAEDVEGIPADEAEVRTRKGNHNVFSHVAQPRAVELSRIAVEKQRRERGR